jgi:hypothetical protein
VSSQRPLDAISVHSSSHFGANPTVGSTGSRPSVYIPLAAYAERDNAGVMVLQYGKSSAGFRIMMLLQLPKYMLLGLQVYPQVC